MYIRYLVFRKLHLTLRFNFSTLLYNSIRDTTPSLVPLPNKSSSNLILLSSQSFRNLENCTGFLVWFVKTEECGFP